VIFATGLMLVFLLEVRGKYGGRAGKGARGLIKAVVAVANKMA